MTSLFKIINVAGLIGVGFFFSPFGAFADRAMEDNELDHITASGQPVDISVGNNSSVIFAPETEVAQVIGASSQAGLRALVLNNVAGENQVANGLNVSGAGQSGQQTNGLTQSWGSTHDTTGVIVPTVTAAIEASCNGALICKSSPAVAVIPGTIRVLSSSGDQILTGGANSAFVYVPQTSIAQKIETNSQTNLVALVVNNVSGLNQVGNAINVQSNGVNLVGDSLSVPGGSGQSGGQHNVLSQYRGTPANFAR